MVKSKAHLQITQLLFRVLKPKNQNQLIITFMICSAFLSMWISNAAAAMMLIPAALAIIESSKDARFTLALLLSICYAASIGGLATPIGTPPNLVFIQAYENASGQSMSFLDWMKWGVPAIFVLLPIAMFYLLRRLSSSSNIITDASVGKSSSDNFVAKLDLAQAEKTGNERRVLLVFLLVILAWMTRADPFGGWSAWFDLEGAHDGYVAILGAVLLFIIPQAKVAKASGSDRDKQAGQPLINWEDAKSIPWGVVLLVAGGISISLALRNTGLISAFAEQFSLLSHWPIWLMIALICLCITFITEIMSNTACASLMMPVLAALAIALNVDPILLMLPAAMTASCAFMMPMATAPNAIVFGTNKIAIQDMIKTGAPLNLMAAGALVLLLFLLSLVYLG